MTAPQGFHELKKTIVEDFYVKDHAPRVATALFERTRKAMIDAGGRCWICNKPHTHEDPLELHHSVLERCELEEIEFGPGSNIRKDRPNYDWSHFDATDPASFVDDALVNGLLLCKLHHTGQLGIHMLTYPEFEAQRYMKEGTPIMEGHVAHFYIDDEKVAA
jgi:hypothetical protein